MISTTPLTKFIELKPLPTTKSKCQRILGFKTWTDLLDVEWMIRNGFSFSRDRKKTKANCGKWNYLGEWKNFVSFRTKYCMWLHDSRTCYPVLSIIFIKNILMSYAPWKVRVLLTISAFFCLRYNESCFKFCVFHFLGWKFSVEIKIQFPRYPLRCL